MRVSFRNGNVLLSERMLSRTLPVFSWRISARVSNDLTFFIRLLLFRNRVGIN